MDVFPDDFRARLAELMRLRRDVRRFRPDPAPAEVIEAMLAAARLAPSVGLSEPWRFVHVASEAARAAALANFQQANARALAGYSGERARLYAGLKLSGMREAPVQLAVFCDDSTPKGAGLGAATMPETRRYSVVAAVTNMWLTARAAGLGMGWVSILDPERLARDLDVPADWSLVAYLCIGWPEENLEEPELERAGWESRAPAPPRPLVR
ncbi:5,6-dimethylbenzimidazole synthase [Oceanicella actignis]|uniref:Cob(II)yrinic acid a,c-diamide reductase n=1 Tax=Oceanicella actignis TaxID=1189325 RepID=A0A1M7TXV9_9RHOB|nr:5,6-dimethylbenzimidazole synthase [Oceanicella actignis]SET80841.1 cob(II)yrinic acid a,c-diamide reductase [Oceanicella actignis]SHN75530.1 cob(II)yrinic acid a,c-diamide reductase [Oceanicella actignis]